MGLDLFEMMEKAKGFLRWKVGDNVLTDEQMQPTAAERKKWEENYIFHLTMGKGLTYIMKDLPGKKIVTRMDSALLQEIHLMEQMFRNKLPKHLRQTKYEQVSLHVNEPGLAKCMFRSLLELESAMKQIRTRSINKAKNERKKNKKKQASASGVQASVEPEGRDEAGLDLFKMMEKAKGFLRWKVGDNVLTDEQMQPTAAERKKWEENYIFHLTMGKGLTYIMKDLRGKKIVTRMDSALLQEIHLMEQKFRNQLPEHLRQTKYEEVSLLVIEPGLAKCMFRSLLELESAMNKERKKNKKKQASVSGVQASVEPEGRDEADDGRRQEDEPTQEASVEPEGRDEADDDVPTQKTCIPKKDLMQYSHGEFTNYNTSSFFRGKLTTSIFRGKLTIPVPPDTTVKEPIHVTYFKMDKKTYEMAGFLWVNFAMKHPNDYILSVYGVGETMDEEYFIVSQTFEQPLSTWIGYHIGFSDDDRLLCELKSFLKDVINGGIQVHDKSKGSLNAEVSINNVYIVNMRAKLGLLSPTTTTKKLMTNFIATFCNMVRDEIFHEIPLPSEFEHFLDFITFHKLNWQVSWHTHPVFLSASQKCKFAKLAYEEVRGSSRQRSFKSELDYLVLAVHNRKFKITGINWMDNVQHETLRDVLKFKSRMGDEDGDEDGEMVVEEAIQVGVEVKKIDYDNSPWSFFKFYRNLVVHTKKGALTDEEIIVEMDQIFPSFLFCVHEALTRIRMYVDV